MNKLVLISGCSGGGKSTLLAELGSRGHAIIEEPGRRIIAQEMEGTGAALPWINMKAFSRRAVDMSRTDLRMSHKKPGIVFFDRGLIDAAVALQHSSGLSYQQTLGNKLHYSDKVFLVPPWREIFRQDQDRRHDFFAALDEFERLKIAFLDLGYSIYILPKTPTRARADFVLGALDDQKPE